LLTAAYKPLVPLFSVDLQEQQKGKEKATLWNWACSIVSFAQESSLVQGGINCLPYGRWACSYKRVRFC
jgi:hypothetical protein